jgi:hypothetical protein
MKVTIVCASFNPKMVNQSGTSEATEGEQSLADLNPRKVLNLN